MERDKSERATEQDVADKESLALTEVFELLSHEARIEIICALYEAHRATGADAVPFSELRDRTVIRDSSQFNYHLSRLVGTFVTDHEDGYRLAEMGREVCQVLVPWVDDDRPDRLQSATPADCTYCNVSG